MAEYSNRYETIIASNSKEVSTEENIERIVGLFKEQKRRSEDSTSMSAERMRTILITDNTDKVCADSAEFISIRPRGKTRRDVERLVKECERMRVEIFIFELPNEKYELTPQWFSEQLNELNKRGVMTGVILKECPYVEIMKYIPETPYKIIE